MVGVPGRSKACLTCKRRRIACDLQHPTCGQCLRSKRECAYTNGLIFILNDEGSYKTKYRKVDRSVCTSKSPTNGSSQASSGMVPLDVERPFGTLTALREQLVAEAHWSDSGRALPAFGAQPWVMAINSFAGSIHALNSAPLSCYTAWLGRERHEPYLVDVSRRLYVQGLREVQAAVNDSKTAFLDETLGACLSMIIYEALECPDQNRIGYWCHIDGCARIIKLRGASAHQDGAAHDLFRSFRYVGLLADLERHRPSFLSTPSWTTLPWQNRDKTAHDHLMDIVALAPEAMRKSDRLPHLPPNLFLPALLELVEDVRTTDVRLLNFYDDLVSSAAEPLWWEENSRVTDASATAHGHAEDPEPVLNFKDYETARLLTLYWAMLALSWSGLNDIHNALLEVLASDQLPPALVPSTQHLVVQQPPDWREPVRKVCKSVKYCYDNAPSGIGALSLAVPLETVIGVMRGRKWCEKEYALATKIMQEIRTRWLRIHQYPDHPLQGSD